MKTLIRFACGSIPAFALIVCFAFSARARERMQDAQHRHPQSPTNRPARVVAVSVRDFVITPSVIHMRVDEKIELDVTAVALPIGLRVNPFPDGAKANTPPGLSFLFGEDCYKAKKDEMVPVLVEATEPGTYTISCCKGCGSNHKSMRAQIIVDAPR